VEACTVQIDNGKRDWIKGGEREGGGVHVAVRERERAEKGRARARASEQDAKQTEEREVY
jgi:hypothetical protein